MSFDLEKLQAVAELGEVIRLQNESLERLAAFRKARPYMLMPNLAKMVEENLKENLQVLYKELNNLHKPAEQQTRYICNECKMAFIVKLPGGVCDECRARLATKPRQYVVPETTPDEDAPLEESEAMSIAPADDLTLAEEQTEEISEDVEKAATGDKLPVEEETNVEASAKAAGDEPSDEFEKFMAMAGTGQTISREISEENSTPAPSDDTAALDQEQEEPAREQAATEQTDLLKDNNG